jgi:hypothetical protein
MGHPASSSVASSWLKFSIPHWRSGSLLPMPTAR